MTSIGKLVECIEDAEITVERIEGNEPKHTEINFYKDIYYTALIEDEIYVIDRNHQNIKVSVEFFKKHFKLVN